jgi:hypothetical protein
MALVIEQQVVAIQSHRFRIWIRCISIFFPFSKKLVGKTKKKIQYA